MALVDPLRCRSAEREWLEFRRRRCAPDQLGQYLSALGNSACLSDQPKGYLVVGVVANRGPVGRKSGRIVNRGSRRRPAWVSSRPSATAGDVHK